MIRGDQAIADAIGISVKQVRSLRKRRIIPVVKRGERTLWYNPEKVKAALDRLAEASVAKVSAITAGARR